MSIGGFGGAGGGFGGQGANLDLQTLGRGFSTVTVVDVIVAHSPLWFCLLTGFGAGLMIWSIPLVFFGLNIALNRTAGIVFDVSFYSRFLPEIIRLVLATGAVGVVLAFLRRVSARLKRYVHVGNMTVGFNTAVATAGGLLLAMGLILSGSKAGLAIWMLGMGAPLIGFMVDGLWQLFHDKLLRWLGRPNHDVLLSIEAENFLRRHPGLYDFRMESVRVENRTAHVRAEWNGIDAMRRAEAALLCIEGIDKAEIVRP